MHTHHLPLPIWLRGFGFILWGLSLLLILALGWFRPSFTGVIIVGLLLYAAAFVLFMLMLIRHYSRRQR